MRFDQAKVGISIVGEGRTGRRTNLAVGLPCSVALHGLLLLPFVLERDDAATISVIPVEIVLLADQHAASQPAASAPQSEVGTTSAPAAVPPGVSSSNERPDDFDLKLQRLAQLRQPGMDAPLPKGDGSSRVTPMRGYADVGSDLVSDFIRAQVERRWSLDLAGVGNRNLSVLIRIEITGAGVVTKADIVKDSHSAADKTYQDIARSARNAVLLSSPFALPPGRYSDALELTLSLNTRDALR
jgi:hypothetical protein